MNYKEEYLKWLNSSMVDQKTKDELKLITDEKEIEDRFYKNLEFGTGGLRGVLAPGSNRMNIYTVSKAAQGFAKYLNDHETDPSICIAYDSRNMSKEFADAVASVLAANNVKVHLYESLRPVPMLSFAVRYMMASGGIVITASHNPKEYNGYKVYGSDGAQIAGNVADEILKNMASCDIFEDIKQIPLNEAQAQGKLMYMGEEVDNAYYEKVDSLVIRKEFVKENAKDLSIIYTPIHGSGNIPVRTMLKRLGFSNVTVVPEQELPDGNFPTASYPNPENKNVFTLAIKLAQDISPDLIFGTDPDCDRIGVVVRMEDGEYTVLTGNQVGVLLVDYMLGAREELGILDKKDTVVKTIVSTEMADAVGKSYGVQVMDVLTGFKYIGEKIKEFKETGSNNFVIGFEESYGYLAGDFVRDKDGVISSVLIAEMALYYKSKGKNLYQALQDLFEKYGYYKEDQVALEMKGKDGQEKIAQIITKLRENPPKEIDGVLVTQIEDYELSILKDVKSGEEKEILLPKSNVIKLKLEDGSWVVVRPSGTEPKMKIYIAVKGESEIGSNEKLNALKDAATQVIQG
ncbi:MAG TPA: phospho-sugar mutase [Epulopiscium sp.]|nr:phospho-sugar mutase [Candidatus Epulonipiscium sp.]